MVELLKSVESKMNVSYLLADLDGGGKNANWGQSRALNHANSSCAKKATIAKISIWILPKQFYFLAQNSKEFFPKRTFINIS